MRNPNAVVAAVAAALVTGAQWLVQRYAHHQLPGYWKTVATSGVIVSFLYVGKHGVKAALVRVWSGPKKLWTGTVPPPPQ